MKKSDLIKVAKVVAMSALVFSATAASAATIALTNPNQFSGNETLLDFSGASGSLSTYGGVAFDLVGPYNGVGVWSESAARQFGPAENTALNNFPSGAVNYPALQITFASFVNRVGFEARSNVGDNYNITLSLVSNNSVVGNITIGTQGASQYYFYGIQSDVAFDRLVFDPQNNVNGAFALDNLRFESTSSAVPDGGMMVAMLGLALGALGLLRRKF